MQSYLDLIFSKVRYNEILSSGEFKSPPFSFYSSAIIQESDGSIFSCFEIKTADSDFSQERKTNKRNLFLPFISSLGSDWEVTFETHRQKDALEYISLYKNLSGSIREIERRREKEFKSSQNLINRMYIVLTLRNKDKNLSLTKQTLNNFINKCEELKNSLMAANTEIKILTGMTLIKFLKYTYDFSTDKIREFDTTQNLSKSFINANYKLKNIPLVVNQSHFVQCFTLSALPSFTYADMFDFLYSLDFEMRIIFKYRSYSREKAQSIITHKKKSYKNSIFSLTSYMKNEMTGSDISDEYNTDALNNKNQCDCCLDYISKTQTSAGDSQITFILFSNKIEELEENNKEFKTIMQKNGFLVKEEGLGNTLCFISSLPACNTYYNPLFILSGNFCDFLHLSSPYQGAKNCPLLEKRTNNKASLIYAKNLDGSLYHFSLSGERGEKGHSFITGPTGSGKSAFLSLLAASFLKYQNTRCIIIGRDLSSLELVSDNNGAIFYPCFDKTCFAVLKKPRENKKKIVEFIKAVCFSQNIEYDSKMHETLLLSLDLLDNNNTLKLSDLYSIIKGIDNQSKLLLALIPYIKDGEYEGLFDATNDSFDIKNPLTLIETNKILKNSINDKNAAIPFFIYLFMHLDDLFNDSKPTLLIIDEGWKILKNQIFASFIEEWIKTLRKKNVDIVFSSTNLADIINTHIAETIISNTQTRIFFKDENAENAIERENYAKLGLSDLQINIIRRTPDFCPVILCEDKVSIVDFRMQNVLDFLTTKPEKKKRFL